MEELVRFDPNGVLVPWLAVSWDFIDDTTWVFNLREGVKFTDGEPFNADVVIYNIDRIRNHPMSQFKVRVAHIASATALDEYTLQLKTDMPFPILPNYLANCAMVSPNYVTEKGDDYIANHPIGTGPYTFVEWVKDDHLTLEVNEDYWGDKPAYERVIFKPIPVGATRVAALLSGEVDVIEAPPVFDLARIEARDDLRVERRASLRVIFLVLDVGRAMGGEAPENSPGIEAGEPNPLLDVRVRKAMYHAINMDDIRDYVMQGCSYPWSQPMAEAVFGYNPDVERLPYDPQLAKQLLTEAGYPDGFKIRLDCPNNRYINDQAIGEAIVGQLAEVGIEVELNAVPKSIFFSQIFNVRKSSLALSGWAESSVDAGALLENNFKTDARFNNGLYSSSEIDSLIEEGVSTMDPQARRVVYQEIVARLMARFDELIYAFEMKPK
jgi:peptide/nickel transport system substrate-binding protein